MDEPLRATRCSGKLARHAEGRRALPDPRPVGGNRPPDPGLPGQRLPGRRVWPGACARNRRGPHDRRLLLDYNATAKVRPGSGRGGRALALGGNPSSVHAAGRAARALVEQARAEVAALVGRGPGRVTFTSGGTEANALAIESAVAAGFARHHRRRHRARHACRKPPRRRSAVEVWPVDADGVADLGWLEARLAGGGRALVCLMLANNETGVIQPVAEAAALVRAADGWLHVDAVQAAGKIAVDFEALWAPTPWRFRPTSSAARRASAPWSPARAPPCRAGCTAAARSAAAAPAPKMSPASPAFGAAARAALADLAIAACAPGATPWPPRSGRRGVGAGRKRAAPAQDPVLRHARASPRTCRSWGWTWPASWSAPARPARRAR